MVMIRPFTPIRYNPALFPDLAPLVAPPYDVIDAGGRDELYERHPYNVIRLILNRDPDPYASAADTWAEWRAERILVEELRPCLVFSLERFRLRDGTEHERAGLFGAIRLEPFASGKIRPHERTFSGPKEDRLQLLRACRANLSPVFGLYADQETLLATFRSSLAQRRPDISLVDWAGTQHRLWFVRDRRLITLAQRSLEEEEVIIADGHHRYETALAYAEERRAAGGDAIEAPYNFVLMYLTSLADPGLLVLPTHRVLGDVPALRAGRVAELLSQHFSLQRFPREQAQELFRALDESAGHHALGVALAGEDSVWLARLRDPTLLEREAPDLPPAVRDLDVTLLDRFVLRSLLGIDVDQEARAGRLWYTHDDQEALAALATGAQAVFLMRPPRLDDLLAVCRAGAVMPQKSTYFYPKLLSGLLFQSVE